MLPLLPMNQVILIYPEEAYDDWGNPTLSDPIEVMGHYRNNSTKETVVGNNGDEVMYRANIYLPANTEVTYESQVGFIDHFEHEIVGAPIRMQLKRDIWGSPMMMRVVI